jgi:hypothetical protein
MSEAWVHINRPSSTKFIARARRIGCRNYELIGSPTKSRIKAEMQMAREFSRGEYKRADVLIYADCYEPTMVVEMVRK